MRKPVSNPDPCRLARCGAAALAVLLALGLCGCSHKPQRRAGPPNVLLISVDTLRADRLGCYGYERPTSPFLDEFAEEAALFENAIVNCHSTGPSHTTMLTGLYQETHRVQWDPRLYRLHKGWAVPAGAPMLQEILRENGYETLGVTEDGYVGRSFGFARGFHRFRDDQPRDVRSSAQALMEFVRQRKSPEKPLFLFFHTYQVHGVYRSPERYRRELARHVRLPGEGDLWKRVDYIITEYMNRARELDPRTIASLSRLYDAAIRYADDALRDLLADLEDEGFFDGEYLIVITADHGEEFGERGGLQHRGVLFEELIHVPLIIRGTRIPAGRRTDLAATADIAPTILRYCGIDPPAWMPGRDLFGGTAAPDFIFTQYGNIAYALRGHRWKLIDAIPIHAGAGFDDPFQLMLFDLENDPGETRNLAAERTDIAREWKARLDRFRKTLSEVKMPGERQLSEKEIERLRSLGYMR